MDYPTLLAIAQIYFALYCVYGFCALRWAIVKQPAKGHPVTKRLAIGSVIGMVVLLTLIVILSTMRNAYFGTI